MGSLGLGPSAFDRAVLWLALLGLAALLALSGCGSSDNGVASKSGKEILAASKAAAKNASSVTITSKAAQGRLAISSMKLKLTEHGGQGDTTVPGRSFQVIRTGNAIYLKGGPELYEQLGITQSVPQGTWLKGTASGQLDQLAAFIDLAREAASIITPSGKITKGATTTIAGQPAIELKTEGKLYKGRLYIKTTGEPYPLKLEKTGEETGLSTFTDWERTPAPTAPTNVTTVSGGG